KHDGREGAGLRSAVAKRGDEASHVFERRAYLHVETLQGGAVAHAEAEAEPPSRELVNEGGRLGIVAGMAGVDIGDGGPERDLPGLQRDRLAQSQAVSEARAVQAREALLLQTLRDLQR